MSINLNVNSDITFRASFYDRFFKSIPNKNLKNPARYNHVGEKLASPHWNRAVIGVAAFTTQPYLDRHNRRVDEETAMTSSIRTMVKIPVCTLVGFMVRGLCYKLASKYIKEGSDRFLPEAIKNEKDKIKKAGMIKLHRNTISTLAALGVMIFTNFLLDAPLTTYFTNKVLEKRAEKKSLNKGGDE